MTTEVLTNGLVPYQDVVLTVVLLLSRVLLGVFFLISGWHKLFVPERHQALVETLRADHIPFIRFNEWWVPGVELVCGALVAVGLFAVPAALTLLVLCLVACAADGLKQIRAMDPLDPADWLDDLLYLPEVLYITLALFIIIGGPGWGSLDHLIFGG